MDIASTNALQEGHQVVKKERKQCIGWSDLPDELLELIMKWLKVTAYLRLRAVCKSWKATIDNAIANRYCPPLPELPLLLLRDEVHHCMFSLSTERIVSHERPLLGAMHVYHGSVEGWLIVSDIADNPRSLAIFFLNPMTNARVNVPSNLNFPNSSPMPALGKLVASSTPNCPNCIVVGSFKDDWHLTYCRISDKSWTMIEAEEGINFLDMAILDGKLYVITTDGVMPVGSILVYDLKVPSCTQLKSKILAQLPERPPPEEQIIDDMVRVSGSCFGTLAIDVASGQLLLIYILSDPVYETEGVNGYILPPRITAFEVFQLDMSSEPQWVKVDSLGERILCLSGIDSKVMPTSTALNGAQEVIRGNCICFCAKFICLADPWRGFNFGVYCLADRSIKYFTLEKSSFENVPCGCWFIPSAW